MLKSDVIWPPTRRFKSGTKWEPVGFFSEALCNATKFDLMLGFFSSSAISILSDSFAMFLYNGGKMRLIINDILTEKDKQAIIAGTSDASELPFFNIEDIENIKDTLSQQDKHFFECLAWLIRNDRIEIKIIALKGNNGISHTKCGVLSDGINRISFSGSCNFTRTALVANIEDITAECDWDEGKSIERIEEIAEDFEMVFSGQSDTVDYIDADEIKTQLTSAFPDKDIKVLLDDEYKLLQSKSGLHGLSDTVRRAIQKASKRVQETIQSIFNKQKEDELNANKPRFPYPTGPRDYQNFAFERWLENRQKGLFAMATGTGKTITSLNCLLEIYKRTGYYKAIILVPTITLVDQWEKECRKFNFSHIIKVCSRYPKWRAEIDDIEFKESMDPTDLKNSYIIISTYASFARENVFPILTQFPKKQLLLIADEAHNMGAGQIKKRLKTVPYVRRIGLSATPERQYDEDTNQKIFKFFGSEDRYTYEYSMREAIDNKVLCRYRYYPHIVKLTVSEMEEYLEISKKLAMYYTFNQDIFRPKDDPILTALLLRRKRIIHKAANKQAVFKSILEGRLKTKGSLQYTLVYVPEGNKPDEDADVFDEKDTIPDDAESVHLIDIYTQIVRDISPTTTVRQFTSASANRDEMLKDFAEGKLDVLTSMKCLDEGVDVPRSELAIFCASTGNPRQFIQRRGRILRTHPDKHMAEIHDLVVAPEVATSEDTYNMERNLLATELKRVYDFASLSENMDDTIREMEDILEYYNLSIFNS